MKYSFTLKDNNLKAYYLFTWFLFFLHVTAAAFTLNNDDDKVKLSMYILLGFYAVIGIVYYFCRKRTMATETFSLVLALFYGHFWLQHAGIIAMLIFAAVYITVTLIKGKRTTVLITEEGIHLTRMFKTATFPWGAMENVVLKDNLLTMDFTTNKIIQVEILENSKMVDETEFNFFCGQQLNNKS
jgi:hypothetical protein